MPESPPNPPSSEQKGAAAMAFVVLILFAFAIGAAMGGYPGGTHWNHQTVGYDFWANFWCDALRNPALNGAPNVRGARMASIAMWVLSSGLIPFWGLCANLAIPPELSAKSAARWVIQWFGVLAMVGMMGVTLLPSSRFPAVHGVAVTAAGPLGLIAAMLAVVYGLTSPRLPRTVSLLGALAIAGATTNLVEYCREFWLHAPSSPYLPGIQKIATLCFLTWIVAVTACAFSGWSRPSAAERAR
jgi:hypothetical protein